MNPLVKGAIGFGVLAGGSGAVYGIYSVVQSNSKISTYAEELKDTLLNTADESDKVKWEARLATLKNNSDLVSDLIPLKTEQGADVWKKLKNWCANNINKQIKSKQDKEFLNIQNYCTFSIKEKIGSAIEPSAGDTDAKWTTAHGKLNGIDNLKLNQKLRTAKSKAADAGKTDVKNWCVETYSKPYKGENDQDFSNAKMICIA